VPNSVLIIDDEPRITAALMVRLQAERYEVYHAINGLAGVEAAALHRPDAIVLDIRMPDIDGYEASARIKRLPGLAEVPIIFLSADTRDPSRLRAIEAGAVEFLTKPYEASDVLAAVERAVARSPVRQPQGADHD
jgi:two-component system KDP operon response regulator KdpE